jgi:predicted phosphodiesterase
MRLAVVSDIHGNLEAFKQVLADIELNRIDTIISLGDNIGYGPNSEQVMSLIRSEAIASIMGNHELALLDSSHLSWFNPLARESLEKTSRKLSDASLKGISGLPRYLVEHACRFVHGFPPESVTTYLFEVAPLKIQQTFDLIDERICFIGHTHKLELIGYDGDQLSRSLLTQGSLTLDPRQRYIVNAGSVGQPRDLTNHAKYIIWDKETDCLEVRFIEYDHVSVAIKIITAGLPKAHAERLY